MCGAGVIQTQTLFMVHVLFRPQLSLLHDLLPDVILLFANFVFAVGAFSAGSSGDFRFNSGLAVT